MNRLYFSLMAFCLVCLTISCNSYQGLTTAGDPNGPMVSTRNAPATDMAELIRRQPGITVTGSGQNLSVRIRGNRSFNATNEPLYIVEGRRMGHEFATIANINPQDVARMNVIRDPGNLAAYGLGASNGVIEIFLVE